LAAADRTDAWVVPYAAACSRVVVLSTWDRFQIPWPFARVVVVLGAPLVEERERTLDNLARCIDGATSEAQAILRGEVESRYRV